MRPYSIVSYPTPLPTARPAETDVLDDISKVLRACNHAMESYQTALQQRNPNAMKWAMMRYHTALQR